jgi:hypothetical protein
LDRAERHVGAAPLRSPPTPDAGAGESRLVASGEGGIEGISRSCRIVRGKFTEPKRLREVFKASELLGKGKGLVAFKLWIVMSLKHIEPDLAPSAEPL